MQLAPWDLVLTTRMSGSVGRGASPSLISQSFIMSFFQWWLLRTCGAHNGSDAMSCSALTTRLWCTSLCPGRSFTLTAVHLPGIHNSIADALSRFHWQEFRRLVPEAILYPTPIPQQLWDLLMSTP